MFKKFRPRKGPTAVALVLISFCLVFGGLRAAEDLRRADLLAHIRDRMAAQAVPLPERILNLELWEHRRVRMAGRFLYNQEFLVRAPVPEGRDAYRLLTPLKRASGGIVFIDRGWIPAEFMDKADRPGGTVSVEGIVQIPLKPSYARQNDPGRGNWYWPDVEAMAGSARLTDVAPVFVTVAARGKGGLPAGGQLRLDIPGDPGQYVVFWFGLALFIAAVWFILYLRVRK